MVKKSKPPPSLIASAPVITRRRPLDFVQIRTASSAGLVDKSERWHAAVKQQHQNSGLIKAQTALNHLADCAGQHGGQSLDDIVLCLPDIVEKAQVHLARAKSGDKNKTENLNYIRSFCYHVLGMDVLEEAKRGMRQPNNPRSILNLKF